MKLTRGPRSTMTLEGELYAATLERALDPALDQAERAAANRFMRDLGDEIRARRVDARSVQKPTARDGFLTQLVPAAIDQRSFGRQV